MIFTTVIGILAAVYFAPAEAATASTTRYYDGLKGACGCGAASGNSLFPWQAGGSGFYTAAGSSSLFGSGTWCGSGCGKCYKLTSTGKAPSGQGTGGSSGTSIIVMVTNLCPNAGNERWCPANGGTNSYGYQYHFDIMTTSPVVGDNSVVDFESIACPSAAASDFKQCQCA